MKKFGKEIIIMLLQLFMFYIFPMFAGPADGIGLVVLILLATFVLAIIMGGFSDSLVKYTYPILAATVFIPTVPIYYNGTAMIHALWYLVVSSAGLAIGILIRAIVKFAETGSVQIDKVKVKKMVFVLIVSAIVAVVCYVMWMIGYHSVKRLDNIPSLALIKQEGEAFGHKMLEGFKRDQLIEIWGEPTETIDSNEDIWQIDGNTAVRINYNGQGVVVMVGVFERVLETVPEGESNGESVTETEKVSEMPSETASSNESAVETGECFEETETAGTIGALPDAPYLSWLGMFQETGETMILKKNYITVPYPDSYWFYEKGTEPDQYSDVANAELDEETGLYTLWHMSDDTIMKTVYEGEIYILKGAMRGALVSLELAMEDQREVVPTEVGAWESMVWGNHLYYNGQGYFTGIYYLGD